MHNLLANISNRCDTDCRTTGPFAASVKGNREVKIQVFDLEYGNLYRFISLHLFIDVVEHIQHVDQAIATHTGLTIEGLAQVPGE